jgi:hypothetical protein
MIGAFSPNLPERSIALAFDGLLPGCWLRYTAPTSYPLHNTYWRTHPGSDPALLVARWLLCQTCL